jgi:AraC family transcriptional regulator, activator of mtrCDE
MSDPLSALLDSLRLRARIIYIGGVCGPWRLDTSGQAPVTFHLVTRGEGWLTTATHPTARRLNAGDLVLFPRDAPHALTGSPLDCDVVDPRLLVAAGTGDADVLCGALDVIDGDRHPLLNALPDEIIVPADVHGNGAAGIAALMQAEALADAAGRDVLVARLAEALFILATRECIDRGDAHGALAGLADKRLRRALVALHAQPAEAWTLEALATVAGMSRTAFAETFFRRVGMTPAEYLLRWRMRVAATGLREEHLSVEAVAERVGYASVASFTRAFARVHGMTPGRYVRRQGPESLPTSQPG